VVQLVSRDAVAAALAALLTGLPLLRMCSWAICPCSRPVLPRSDALCVPFCLVYALDCHRAASESGCDTVAVVPTAVLTGLPLARLSALAICLSLFRFCRVLTRCRPFCLVYASIVIVQRVSRDVMR
jgi:hypothetical protein